MRTPTVRAGVGDWSWPSVMFPHRPSDVQTLACLTPSRNRGDAKACAGAKRLELMQEELTRLPLSLRSRLSLEETCIVNCIVNLITKDERLSQHTRGLTAKLYIDVRTE
jgi:hypothetical protein